MTVKEHLSAIIAHFSGALFTKYHRGQEEHGGYLWEKPGMLVMLEQELLDATVYHFTLRQQLQSSLDYLVGRDFESAKKILIDILGEPVDKGS